MGKSTINGNFQVRKLWVYQAGYIIFHDLWLPMNGALHNLGTFCHTDTAVYEPTHLDRCEMLHDDISHDDDDDVSSFVIAWYTTDDTTTMSQQILFGGAFPLTSGYFFYHTYRSYIPFGNITHLW